MRVKPASMPGEANKLLRVRGPDGVLLPDAGAEVPNSQFWNRRLLQGDVVLVDLTAPLPPADPA